MSTDYISVSPSAELNINDVNQAAALWSAVGANVRVGLDGTPIVLLDDAAWNSTTWSDTAEGLAIDGRVVIHGSDYARLLPGQRIDLLAHEIGHLLGLSHVIDDEYAVMYRTIHNLPAEGLRPSDAVEYFSVHTP